MALRYANVYGPRQDPLGEGGVIAIYCGCLASGATPLIFGDGEQTRDFVYVGDIVARQPARRRAPRRSPAAVNIGSGIETSVLHLAGAMRELGGDAPFEPRFESARAGEVRRSCLDAAKAGATLGWQPEVDLHEGLRRTLAHVSASGRVGTA